LKFIVDSDTLYDLKDKLPQIANKCTVREGSHTHEYDVSLRPDEVFLLVDTFDEGVRIFNYEDNYYLSVYHVEYRT